MKRSSSDDDIHSSAMKRSRDGGTGDAYHDALASGYFELRLLIPTRCAGALIGRQGDNISDLRKRFNAVLQVPDRMKPERAVILVMSIDRMAQCLAEMVEKISERLMEDRSPRANDELDLRMLIHQSHAGAIIGKGGAKISELRNETGAQLKVFKDLCPNSSDRVLQVTTTKEKLPDVLMQLVNFMSETEIKGPQRPYDCSGYNAHAIGDYGGYAASDRFSYGGGGGYASNRPSYGSSSSGYRSTRGSQYGGGGGSGGSGGVGHYESSREHRSGHRSESSRNDYRNDYQPYDDRHSYRSNYRSDYRSDYRNSCQPPTERHDYRGNYRGGDYYRDDYANEYGEEYCNGSAPAYAPVSTQQRGVAVYGNPASVAYMGEQSALTTTQVTIPDELGGTIIGKGGERINHIRMESGARIDVGATYAGSERIITISGTPQQIQNAQYLLQMTVRTSESGRRYLEQQQYER